MTRILLPLFFAAPLFAESPDLFRLSQAAVVAGASLDVASSYGLHERNPVLGTGQFSHCQAAISMALTVAVLAIEEPIVRRHPSAKKWLAPLNFVVGATRGAAAVHNWRVQR